MCLPLEEHNFCRRNIFDHEQSKAAMPLLSPHEQNFSDDRCQPIPTEIQRDLVQRAAARVSNFQNWVKCFNQKISNASAQGFYLYNHLYGQQANHLNTLYLTVDRVSLFFFCKLNNKVIFNYLITNKSYLLFYK